MIQLTLIDEKKKKILYEQDFIPGRKVREALEMIDSFESDELSEPKRLDKMVEFVASVFDDKDVTTDALYDGIKAPEFVDTINNVIDQVLGREKKMTMDEK